MIKSARFYFLDPALVCYLTRQPDAAAALAGPLAGALFEGWVVSEAAKAFMAVGRRPDLYFWRSHDGLEVDLLIVAGGRLLPVEIKLTATPVAGHLTALNRFIALAHDEAAASGWLVCRSAQVRELPNGHLAIPWQQFPTRLAALLAQA